MKGTGIATTINASAAPALCTNLRFDGIDLIRLVAIVVMLIQALSYDAKEAPVMADVIAPLLRFAVPLFFVALAGLCCNARPNRLRRSCSYGSPRPSRSERCSTCPISGTRLSKSDDRRLSFGC